MPRARLAAVLVVLALSACAPTPSADPPQDDAPIGPVAPGPLTLQRVAGIITDADAPSTTLFTPGDTVSTSGEDLASEIDYWISVGGAPQTCAAVVSSPYLVSGHDTGARLDDPSALIATLTEVDEDRFGLIQVYARQFDDAATASAFLDEVTDAVNRCEGYTLSDDGTVSYRAVTLRIEPLEQLPAGVAGLHYVETVESSLSTGVTTSFLQRDAIVLSVYAETTASSTISAAQADELTATIASRLAAL
jgi:hypothetical protein